MQCSTAGSYGQRERAAFKEESHKIMESSETTNIRTFCALSVLSICHVPMEITQ